MFDFVSGYSELEILVRYDMFKAGLDPDKQCDIELFWEWRLS